MVLTLYTAQIWHVSIATHQGNVTMVTCGHFMYLLLLNSSSIQQTVFADRAKACDKRMITVLWQSPHMRILAHTHTVVYARFLIPIVPHVCSYWQRSGMNKALLQRTFCVRARYSSTNFMPCSFTLRAVFTPSSSTRELSYLQWSGWAWNVSEDAPCFYSNFYDWWMANFNTDWAKEHITVAK